MLSPREIEMIGREHAERLHEEPPLAVQRQAWIERERRARTAAHTGPARRPLLRRLTDGVGAVGAHLRSLLRSPHRSAAPRRPEGPATKGAGR